MISYQIYLIMMMIVTTESNKLAGVDIEDDEIDKTKRYSLYESKIDESYYPLSKQKREESTVSKVRDFSGEHQKPLVESSSPFSRSTTGSLIELTMTEAVLSVAKMAWEALDQHQDGCHYLLVTSGTEQPLASQIVRYSSTMLEPLVLIDVNELELVSGFLNGDVLGRKSAICRGILVDLTRGSDDVIFKFLEDSKVWLWPDAHLVLVGSVLHARDAVLQYSLRNTLQPLYLGLQREEILNSDLQRVPFLRSLRDRTHAVRNGEVGQVQSDPVHLYSRCLYCDEGKAKLKFLSLWDVETEVNQSYHDPFPDQLQDMHGAFLRVVSMALFPYSAYTKDTDQPATTVTMRDSLDKRILDTLSSLFNFRYEVRAPWDGQWGIPTENGNWTGLLGTIQYDKADFTTVMSTNPSRNTIVNHERIYVADVMAVVSLKPQVLPPYLLIIRPFTADVWMWLILSILLWGMSLWLLLKIRSSFTGEEGIFVGTAIFYSWAVILEDPPKKQYRNTMGQMLLGWWLVGCLVITTGFKAALVAYFTVQTKTPPIDNFEDMVNQNNWKWGIERAMMTGGPLSYFKSSNDPVVKQVYQYVESLEEKDGLAKVLRGGYSFLDLKNDITTNIASYHTDPSGRTPYYISKYGHKMLSDFGWGFRKGAPFRRSFTLAMNRLIEGGLIDHWTKEIMTSRVREKRRERAQQGQNSTALQYQILQDDETTAMFRMSHMMGLLLILLIGFTVATLIFFGELLFGRKLNNK